MIARLRQAARNLTVISAFRFALWHMLDEMPESRPCILVAEDDAILRYALVRSLTQHGYHPLEARDGAEALQISQGHEGRIDLLITNVAMPRVAGTELARMLKQDRPDMLVLIISGFHSTAFPPDVLEYAQALLKPVDPVDLVIQVDELLGKTSPPARTQP